MTSGLKNEIDKMELDILKTEVNEMGGSAKSKRNNE